MAKRRRRDRRQKPSINVVPPGLEGGWYKPLAEGDVKRIHEASLDVLERVGIEVLPSKSREIFRQAGARIDADRDRVYLSRPLLRDGARHYAHPGAHRPLSVGLYLLLADQWRAPNLG